MEDLMDDDFGDLYADVEVQASAAINSISNFTKPHTEPEPREQRNDINANSDKIVPDTKERNFASVGEKLGNSTVGESGSEDDLKIVLNDEDRKGPTAAGTRNDIGVSREVLDDDGGKRGTGENGLDYCGGGNGHGVSNRGNAVKRGNNAQILQSKHGKAYGSKGTECEMVASCSTNFAGGDWQDNRWKQKQAFNSSHGGYGYGFPLPWYRPPQVEVSSFFNFGFTNDSWRQYCISMEQLQQQHYIHSYELAKRSKACNIRSHHGRVAQQTIDEDVNQVGSLPKHEKEVRHLGLPIGRAIQVEESTVACQPTMDMRATHVWDSDVVIKINVQDSCNMSSGCGEKKLSCVYNSRSEASKIRDSTVNDTRNVQSSPSAGGDNLSAESLEGNIRCTSSLERCSPPSLESGEMPPDCGIHENNQIIDADGYNCQMEVAQASEDSREPLENIKNVEEKIERNKSRSNQCLVETDITQGDWSQLSGSLSFTASDSETSEGSIFSFAKESYGHLQRSCSGTELLESVSYEQNSPKSNSAIRKSVSSRSYSNERHPVLEEKNDQDGRLSRIAEGRIQHDNDYPISRGNSSVHKSRWIERLNEFDSHSRDYFSNHKDRDFSCDYDNRFLEKHVQANYNKHPHRKYHHNFRDEVESRERTWNEEFSCRRNFRFCYQNDMVHEGEDRHSIRREAPYQDIIPLSYKGCRQYDSRDGMVRRRGKSENFQSAKITNLATCFPDRKSDLVQDKYKKNVSFANLRKGPFDKRLKGPRSCIGRNVNLFDRRVRYTDDSPMDLDNAWGMEIGDEHQNLASRPCRESYAADDGRFLDRMAPVSDMCGSRLTENYGTHGRRLLDDDYRLSGCHGSWNDLANVKDGIMYRDNEFRLGRSKCRALREGSESISRHGYGEFYAERNSYPCERNARDENDELLVDHMLSEQHRYNLTREDNRSGVLSKSHNMIPSGESEKIIRRCGYPIDLTVGNGKSFGRYFNGGSRSCNNKLGVVVDMDLGEKQTISKKISESLKGKATQTGILKTEVKQHGQRRFGKAAATCSNLIMDIEEGQIVPEEPKMKDRSNPNCGSESALLNQNRRPFNRNIDSRGNETTKEYDDQRILDSLAKMERRRERFKDPVMLKKEPDNSPCTLNDPIAGAVESAEQERPSRKRRWGGG